MDPFQSLCLTVNLSAISNLSYRVIAFYILGVFRNSGHLTSDRLFESAIFRLLPTQQIIDSNILSTSSTWPLG